MRTPLILAAAVAVAASTAAAANFDINAADATLDDISSGTSDVLDCTNGLEADLVHGSYLPDENDWVLSAVTVEAADGALAESCAGYDVTVVVENSADDTPVPIEIGPLDVDTAAVDGVLTFDVPAGDNGRVNPAVELSILVDQPDL